MKNFKLTIAYDGTRYNGWQRQENTDWTIQGKLEAILARYMGEPVEVHGSGRTDAGVHAKAQVANVKLETELTSKQLQQILNQYLPLDIRILSAEEVEERFHARLKAVGKCYSYRVTTGQYLDVFRRDYQLHQEARLDAEAMRQAAKLLTGRHDYASFSSLKKTKKSTVRTVWDIEISEQDYGCGQDITFVFTGEGFLYHMVRLMVGALMDVGEGKMDAAAVEERLNRAELGAQGRMVPAAGLCLEWVQYESK